MCATTGLSPILVHEHWLGLLVWPVTQLYASICVLLFSDRTNDVQGDFFFKPNLAPWINLSLLKLDQ